MTNKEKKELSTRCEELEEWIDHTTNENLSKEENEEINNLYDALKRIQAIM